MTDSRTCHCPSCGDEFTTESRQAVCPRCRCVFIAGQSCDATPWHIGDPVPTDVPQDSELTEEEARAQHRLLYLMSRHDGVAGVYPLVELNLQHAARILRLQGRVDSGPNSTIVLNSSGRARLTELTERFGAPAPPLTDD